MTEQIDKDVFGHGSGLFMVCIMLVTSIAAFGACAEDIDEPLAVLVAVLPYLGITFFTLIYQGISAWRMFKNKSAYVCIVCSIIFLGICLTWLGVMLHNEIIDPQFMGYYSFLSFIQIVSLAKGIGYSVRRKDL